MTDILALDIAKRRREFSPAVRATALRRAGFRCQECGSRGPLELHHIGSRADRSGWNCAVLCAGCHRAEHQRRVQQRRRRMRHLNAHRGYWR